MVYDSILCVASKHKDISLMAIRSLLLFSQSRNIYVITSRENSPFFKKHLETYPSVTLLDEDRIIEGISLQVIQEYFNRRIGTPQRAGWYFQQFLKMSICRLPDLADHYLVWDSDTIALQPLRFIDPDGRVLVDIKTEHHKPYFELTQRVLGIERLVDFSFISEHLMIHKEYMNELISHFEARSSIGSSWVWLILNSIDERHLGQSGFSEYETYGNFMASKYKDSFRCRPLKSTRRGTHYFGMLPNRYDCFYMMLEGYTMATFETSESMSTRRIAVTKGISRILYMCCLFTCLLTSRFRARLNAADELCGSALSYPGQT